MQLRVQRRISSLLQDYRLGNVGALETSFDKTTTGRVNTVHVRLQVQSLPVFFSSFGGMNMEVNASGPYLFTVN